tara:strand:+ start:213 stop:839 length:627 start_codon:yes stop_codon:yes gene_type:complete
MALATLLDIKQSVADWLNRSDLTDQIPDFIALANSEAQRKLDVPVTKQIINRTVTAAEATAKKFFVPFGSNAIISITDSKGRSLNPVSFKEYQVYTQEAGNASVYASTGGEVYIGPPPAENDVFTIQYFDGDATWVFNYQDQAICPIPEPILMGSLMYAYMYLKDDNRVSLYKEKFNDAIESYNRTNKTLAMGRIKDESIAFNGGPLA